MNSLIKIHPLILWKNNYNFVSFLCSIYIFLIEEFIHSMEIRTLARKNTIISLNKTASTKVKTLPSEQLRSDKENLPPIKNTHSTHPAFQYIRSTTPSESDFKKFSMLLYKGLHYGIKCLKGPSAVYLKKKKVRLP